MNLVIDVPERLKATIDTLSSADGVSASEWALDALERQVFLRRFESVRTTVLAELDARGESYTDEDVFRMVS
jgi:hypothetical protein